VFKKEETWKWHEVFSEFLHSRQRDQMLLEKCCPKVAKYFVYYL